MMFNFNKLEANLIFGFAMLTLFISIVSPRDENFEL